MQIVKRQELATAVIPSTLSLINSITEGNAAVIKQKAYELIERGAPKFKDLFLIPHNSRVKNIVDVIGQRDAHALMIVLLQRFVGGYNVKNNMTAEQVVDYASDLLHIGMDEHMSMEDFVVFFELAKRGEYGKVYDRLDGGMINEMLEKHLTARWEAIQVVREEMKIPAGDRMSVGRSGEEDAMMKLATVLEKMRTDLSNK